MTDQGAPGADPGNGVPRHDAWAPGVPVRDLASDGPDAGPSGHWAQPGDQHPAAPPTPGHGSSPRPGAGPSAPGTGADPLRTRVPEGLPAQLAGGRIPPAGWGPQPVGPGVGGYGSAGPQPYGPGGWAPGRSAPGAGATRIEPVPGTEFGVAYASVPPVVSGLAVGSLVAGIGSILVALVVTCFGLAGARGGWGAWTAGAFALLALLASAVAIMLGLLARRQISAPAPASAVRYSGRGLAVAGMSCGGVGLVGTVLAFGAALALQLG